MEYYIIYQDDRIDNFAEPVGYQRFLKWMTYQFSFI